jgi:uncharacterized protein
VPKNAVKAIEWYQKAAEQGDVSAQFKLGVMYRSGEGMPKNAVKAAEWFKKAAAQGDADAQFNLGVMYNTGEGVAKDLILAYAWLNLAATQDVENASKTRDMLELNSVERIEAERMSSNWKTGQVLQRDGVP